MHGLAEGAGGLGDIGRIQFDPDISATEPARDEAHRARSEKGIEHKVIRSRGGENTRLNQCLGKRCNVGTARIRGIDVPNRAPVSFAAILGAFFYRFMVIGILLAFGQHEEIFVRASRPIFHTLRHCVWLMPDDVAAEEPTIVLQRESEAPRDAKQVFVLETGWIVRAHIHRAIWIFLVGSSPSAVTAGVAISDIQPQDAVRFNDPSCLCENRGKRLNESCQGRLKANLTFNSVITQSPVGRRGDDTLHRFAREA